MMTQPRSIQLSGIEGITVRLSQRKGPPIEINVTEFEDAYISLLDGPGGRPVLAGWFLSRGYELRDSIEPPFAVNKAGQF